NDEQFSSDVFRFYPFTTFHLSETLHHNQFFSYSTQSTDVTRENAQQIFVLPTGIRSHQVILPKFFSLQYSIKRFRLGLVKLPIRLIKSENRKFVAHQKSES
ncbi:hypothetical protein Bhyg_07980, partial [Pseudolycoriella hygida]